MFHRSMAALAAMIAGAAMAATTPHTAAAAASAQLTVNLATNTGAVMGGASGALYGLSADGVPGSDAFDALNVKTVAVAPPGAAQHPTGHADVVDSEFFGGGGKTMLVYMQDIYSNWPYQDLGLSDYLPKVETIVRQLSATPYASRIAYVPFNEPDWIWYGLNTSDASQYAANRDRFLADWTTVYHAIRSIDPTAMIVGPNEAYYDSRFMPDFLSYAKANNVLPQVISWHELSPSSLQTFPSSVKAFRALEAADGIPGIQIDIDEYANRYNLSVPGEMVQWLSMFESAKVDADMPFWDIADNYSDTVVRNDEPNGQWWLLYWYGQLSGHTVNVSVPSPDSIDTLQGLAALDPSKRQARVLVADPAGSSDSVTITGIDPAIFGASVHVSIQSAGWTGYDGAAYTPLDTAETGYRVVNGSVTVPLGTVNPMTAYQLIVTPTSGATISAPPPPGTQTYLAANASLTDATVYSQGSVSNANGYATAGGKDVGSIDQPDSRVAFTVTAPSTGRYLMSVYYGNQTGTIAQQILRVDSGPWSFVSYPPTLNWLFRSHQDVYLDLTAGTHTITFGVSDPSAGTARGQVTLDDIQLTYAPGQLAGVTGPGATYPAAYAGLSGSAATVPCGGPACSAAQSVVLGSGGSAAFAVDAGTDGFYRLSVAGSGNGNLTADRVAVSPGIVYLHAGINPVTYKGAGTINALRVTPAPGTAVTYAASASQNVLSGTAIVQSDPYADGGQYVGWIGNGAANTLTFTGVTAPRTGTYRVMVSYADNDRAGSGNYNSNLIDRGFTVTTSAGTSVTVYARNTYSWDQFDTVEATVALNAGANTITIGNPSYYAPNIDKIIVAPAS